MRGTLILARTTKGSRPSRASSLDFPAVPRRRKEFAASRTKMGRGSGFRGDEDHHHQQQQGGHPREREGRRRRPREEGGGWRPLGGGRRWGGQLGLGWGRMGLRPMAPPPLETRPAPHCVAILARKSISHFPPQQMNNFTMILFPNKFSLNKIWSVTRTKPTTIFILNLS